MHSQFLGYFMNLLVLQCRRERKTNWTFSSRKQLMFSFWYLNDIPFAYYCSISIELVETGLVTEKVITYEQISAAIASYLLLQLWIHKRTVLYETEWLFYYRECLSSITPMVSQKPTCIEGESDYLLLAFGGKAWL